MINKYLKVIIALAFLAGCDYFSSKSNLSNLTVETENGPVTYKIETADTHEKMALGLMNRETLAENSGMIFLIGGQSDVAMWMKDTLISLDMLFANQKGEIIWIYENAEPQSTELIQPKINEPLFYVVELNGGDVARHGIKIGDKIKHSSITQ